MGITPNVVANTPILSTWGNETRDRAMQVFATIAERSSQWPTPPNGAHCFVTATGSVYVYAGGAWVWMAGTPLGARLTMVGAVSVPNASPYTVAWDTVSWNNGTTTATGGSAGITVLETGIYLVTANVILSYNGASAMSRLQLQVNGVASGDTAVQMVGTATIGLGLTIAHTLSLTAGQKVSTLNSQGSSNAAAIRSDSHLAVTRQ